MKTLTLMAVPLMTAGLALPAAAEAATTLPFTGSLNALASVAPDAGCAPLLFRGSIGPTLASSSLGQFTYSHSVCIVGAAGPVSGVFDMLFADGSLAGTLDGTAAASGTPNVFNQNFLYTVTGGTGRFLDATGMFTGIGVVDARNPPPQVSFAFDGSITAAAVPEPGSWLLLLTGFGLMGWIMRFRRSRLAIV